MGLILGYEYFQTHAAKSFQELPKDQYFSDAILATGDGQEIRVHKVILASSGTFFQKIIWEIYASESSHLSKRHTIQIS